MEILGSEEEQVVGQGRAALSTGMMSQADIRNAALQPEHRGVMMRKVNSHLGSVA